MYDLNRIKQEFNEILSNAGVQLNTRIVLNSRLTRTAGRVISSRDSSTNLYYVSSIEFSKQLIETSTDKSIHDVILHEAAHAISIARTGVPHGHDLYFKSICKEIGCENDGTSTAIERTVAESALYKYQIYCPTCKKILRGGFRRMCNTLKNIDHFSCKNCGNGNLEIIQNY